jgi:hypothetical protein
MQVWMFQVVKLAGPQLPAIMKQAKKLFENYSMSGRSVVRDGGAVFRDFPKDPRSMPAGLRRGSAKRDAQFFEDNQGIMDKVRMNPHRSRM